MASGSGNNQLDLASVLQRLRQYSDGQGSTGPESGDNRESRSSASVNRADDDAHVLNSDLSSTQQNQPQKSTRPTVSFDAVSILSHRQPARPTTPPVDPATITEWIPGLRCVSKMAETNPHFKNSIRKMMMEQQRQEKTWWKGREALLDRQSSRVSGSQSVKDILQSIGGVVSSNTARPDPEKLEGELTSYDQKVYRAQQEMYNAMNMEFKRLGVPFFGMRTDYLVKLKDAELLELQRKMLNYLEEMYGL